MSFEWSFGDGATADVADPAHVYETPGRYLAALTVTDPDGRRSQSTVPITVGRAAPTLAVREPSARLVRAGELVPLLAEVSDPFEPAGDLAVRWEVRLVHNDHEHPGFFDADGPRASFRALAHGTTGEVTFYTATATVTDGEGVEAAQTVALPLVEAEVVLGTVRPAWSESGEASFPSALPVRSVLVPDGSTMSDSLAVALRVDGEWVPARYPNVVAEPAGARVLFVETEADGVRVSGGGASTVRVRLGDDVGPPAGFTVGGAATLAAVGDTLVVSGGGAFEGDYPFVYAPLGEGEGVTARVDAVLSGWGGVGVRASPDAPAEGALLVLAPDGGAVLWSRDAAGVVRQREVATAAPPAWLRLVRGEGGVQASVSSDGATWQRVGSVPVSATLGGAAVVGGAGWFSGVRAGSAGGGPVLDDLTIRSVGPNPTTGPLVVEVETGRVGAYEAEVFDVLGRRVVRAVDVVVVPSLVTFALDLSGVGAGAYLVRVRHAESGDVAVQAVTRVR